MGSLDPCSKNHRFTKPYYISKMWKVKKTSQNAKENLETVPYTVVATHHVGKNSVSFGTVIKKSNF